MKKVVDVNYLRDPACRLFLSNDPHNQVIITDYAAMECYKGNALSNIVESTRILRDYPNQVLVLKGTRQIIQAQGAGPLPPDALIDPSQTKGFRDFCRAIVLAEAGDQGLREQIATFGQQASMHVEQMRHEAAGTISAIVEIGAEFTPEELKQLRRRERVSRQLGDKLVNNILLLAAFLFRDHPDVDRLPKDAGVRDTLIFRFAMSAQLLVMRWLSFGGVTSVPLDKMRNDVVDMTYVAYATFFDGLLSNDKKMLEIHEEAEFFLEHIFHMS